jgi:PAS domain S-box-containing protein
MSNMSKTQYDLEDFFELSPDLLCIAGFDGYFKKVNASVCKTLGYELDELLSSPIDHFIHPDDRELTLRKRKDLHNGVPLFQFVNRYLTKNGSVVHLFWTSVPKMEEQLVFAIAKDISHKNELKNHPYVQEILKGLNTEQMQRFSAEIKQISEEQIVDTSNRLWLGSPVQLSEKDQLWLNKFEQMVRVRAAKLQVNLRLLSSDMAMSERQLFREVRRIMGITPNKLICIIRLHLAWEAITARKYHTLGEIAAVAGFSSKSHFKKLFNKIYGIDIMTLIQ